MKCGKTKSVYQFKGPACKVTLLRHLTTLKMQSRSDVRENLWYFSNIINEINELDVQIDEDLLLTMLLISRIFYAIELRDVLPSLEILRLKIMEKQTCD